MTDPDTRRRARDAWRAANDFPELCELGARFVEGDLAHFPGWGAPETDDETDRVADLLAAACRAGFLTVASQLGSEDEPGADGRLERRRAFVTGFIDPVLGPALEDLGTRGLRVVLDQCTELALGLRGADAFLALGPGAREAELELFGEDLGPAGRQALDGTRWIAIVDPEWGRDDHLWTGLAAALGTPYP
jgi:Domain of unknown function (DUF6919)